MFHTSTLCFKIFCPSLTVQVFHKSIEGFTHLVLFSFCTLRYKLLVIRSIFLNNIIFFEVGNLKYYFN